MENEIGVTINAENMKSHLFSPVHLLIIYTLLTLRGEARPNPIWYSPPLVLSVVCLPLRCGGF